VPGHAVVTVTVTGPGSAAAAPRTPACWTALPEREAVGFASPFRSAWSIVPADRGLGWLSYAACPPVAARVQAGEPAMVAAAVREAR
jgi:hypothetical protein